jgi:hypothetical protein
MYHNVFHGVQETEFGTAQVHLSRENGMIEINFQYNGISRTLYKA